MDLRTIVPFNSLLISSQHINTHFRTHNALKLLNLLFPTLADDIPPNISPKILNLTIIYPLNEASPQHNAACVMVLSSYRISIDTTSFVSCRRKLSKKSSQMNVSHLLPTLSQYALYSGTKNHPTELRHEFKSMKKPGEVHFRDDITNAPKCNDYDLKELE
ncbi:uncharacterized protein BDR25DRAFT_362882 [Lindgomyces ingoldianus]|uniref:Uncharacterized protein n=1 Tax=Lindgomyces ingoldianus TaxID=673940 RepID=A0ACB6Q8N8_9PLEO|nr:uncharacterized protein BDR25DRAFT_362882 [Lindgomyces ingoldianus]KAF2463333.1 hypothetical protein BDR25DRAFT_362882 [Lindgomyces ingoldianus]